jgi:hypothetical protein
MSTIGKATTDQADRLFEIMVTAIEVGYASFYPAEVIDIWNKGHLIRKIFWLGKFFRCT